MDFSSILNVLKQESTYEDRMTYFTGQKAPKMDPNETRISHRKCTESALPPVPAGSISIPLFTRTAAIKTYCSSSPFASLKRAAIADLAVNIPAKGYYLLLRTIEQPISINGVSTIVEDHEGDVYLFCAYNLVLPEMVRFAEDFFPAGTVFILKEPLLKPGLSGDFLIRSDSPSDVIILSEYHKLHKLAKDVKWKNKLVERNVRLPDKAQDWKQRGNTFFDSQNYQSALDSYFMALTKLKAKENNLKKILHLNISLTCLFLKNYESALEFSLLVLAEDSENLKALYRAGRAHYELREFDKAEGYFKRLITAHPGHQEGVAQLHKTKKRLKERRGDISIKELYKSFKASPGTSIDCADYVGPVKVVALPKKRRSVIATVDIKPGTLLIASKAIVSVFHQVGTPVYRNRDGTTSLGEISTAVQETCMLVYNNPNTIGLAVYDLPINDGFLDAIRPKLFSDEDKEEVVVDTERIKRVLTTNGVSIDKDNQPFGLVSGSSSSCAVFQFPSYMSHSCLANASWTTYNDVMIVHANQNIKAGEEITIAYLDPLARYSFKETNFNKRELECMCLLCEGDRKVPEIERRTRENLILEIEKLAEENAKASKYGGSLISPKSCQMIAEKISKIEKLIKATGLKQLQVYLALPHLTWSTFTSRQDAKKGIEILWKAISYLGFDVETVNNWSKGREYFASPPNALFNGTILGLIEILVLAYHKCGMDDKASKYMRALHVGHAVYRGASNEMVTDAFEKGLS